MTDKEFRQTRNRVFKLAKQWQIGLGLAHWTVSYVWNREGMVVAGDDNEHEIHVAANCTAQWQYMQAMISLNLPVLAGLTDYEVERVLLHEFMHLLVNEMEEDEDCHNHEERVCAQLTNAFCNNVYKERQTV